MYKCTKYGNVYFMLKVTLQCKLSVKFFQEIWINFSGNALKNI